MSNRLPFLYLQTVEGKGKCIFTAQAIPEGSSIEICPVILLNAADCATIHTTRLHDYYFHWGTEGDCAIALGFGSIYNHSSQANADYEMLLEDELIGINAIRNIEAGEEITINYMDDGEQKSKLWFEEV